MATSHYGIPELNRNSGVSADSINSAYQKIDAEMWKLPQYRGYLTSSNSINDLSEDGFWFIQGTVPTGAPSNVTWSMLIQITSGGVRHQYIIKPTSSILFMREYTGSPAAWSAWKEVQEHTASTVEATRSGSIWISGSITAIKKNGIVTLKLANMAHTAVTARTTIATLPTGYRPYAEASFCADRDTNKWFFVTPGGEVRIDPCSAGSAYGLVTYVTA